MKRVVLGLVLCMLAAPAWAADSFRIGDGYTDREKRRNGGQTYEFDQINARADRLELTATSGRSELENIQIYGRDGFKADLSMLQYEDVRNKEIDNHKKTISSDGYNGEPTTMIIYLPQTVDVEFIEVQFEAWTNNAYVQLELEQDFEAPPADDEPYYPPTRPDPVLPPAPQCDVSGMVSQTLQCSTSLSDTRRMNDSIERNLLSLRSQVEARNARIGQCHDRKSEVLSAVTSTESWLNDYDQYWDNTSTRIDSVIRDNKQKRRRIFRIENPAQQWRCYLTSRDGTRWEETGTNRVQMLQKMVRKCGDGPGKCGGKKWNPSRGKGSWGCNAIRGSRNQEPKVFDEDKLDEERMPGEKRETKRRKNRQQRDGERRGRRNG